jgi:hypothetical protein
MAAMLTTSAFVGKRVAAPKTVQVRSLASRRPARDRG